MEKAVDSQRAVESPRLLKAGFPTPLPAHSLPHNCNSLPSERHAAARIYVGMANTGKISRARDSPTANGAGPW